MIKINYTICCIVCVAIHNNHRFTDNLHACELLSQSRRSSYKIQYTYSDLWRTEECNIDINFWQLCNYEWEWPFMQINTVPHILQWQVCVQSTSFTGDSETCSEFLIALDGGVWGQGRVLTGVTQTFCLLCTSHLNSANVTSTLYLYLQSNLMLMWEIK